MTDNEIIKALEHCIEDNCDCGDCPAISVCQHDADCPKTIALDLINRQKAEIERLKAESEKHSDECLNCYAKGLSEGGTEAVKKFAESLKEDIINIQMNGKYQHYAIPTKKVDKLLKEMGVVE